MSVLLARIDDRLVHGQVVLGCCEPLRAQRILLCDDAVAGDSLQQTLFRAATPPEIELEVHDVHGGARRLASLEREGRADETILLVASCPAMASLVGAGASVASVNVGGLHARPGADEVWPGFFLDPEDRRALLDLISRGVRVQVQTVPGAPCIDAREALSGWAEDSR